MDGPQVKMTVSDSNSGPSDGKVQICSPSRVFQLAAGEGMRAYQTLTLTVSWMPGKRLTKKLLADV